MAYIILFAVSCMPGAIKANSVPGNVWVYGDIVGLSMNCAGLIVEESAGVETKDGYVNTTARSNIRKGDILIGIENYKITSAEDVGRILSELARGAEQTSVGVTLLRGNMKVTTKVLSVIDESSGEPKLGLWTRDHVSGIGTLTYATEDGRFGALGHGVTERGNYFPVSHGDLFPAEILGIRHGENGVPGCIQGTFSYYANPIASISSNGISGINGLFKSAKKGLSVPFGGKEKARAGKASIVSCVSGCRKEYDIEIVRARAQSSVAEKGMVIRVTDPELLELTGGIVQGMSGSPILQDGFWIGAITHVFNNSPREGYGIYANWML